LNSSSFANGLGIESIKAILLTLEEVLFFIDTVTSTISHDFKEDQLTSLYIFLTSTQTESEYSDLIKVVFVLSLGASYQFIQGFKSSNQPFINSPIVSQAETIAESTHHIQGVSKGGNSVSSAVDQVDTALAISQAAAL